ncbi:hypothetical protein SHKM778_85710 [Streptomyces sp. KM77-8]|uniref:Uncharacterized protein n=1 Tax=Streptomyces haneummycinicus TaxID=3074435 RepID=A0AAT9HYB3_9ACTN
MLTDRLDVAHLETGTFQQGHRGAQRGEFAVGEDVGVDEGVHPVRRLVPLRAARDLVVQQPSAGPEQPVQGGGVLQIALGADVFGHTDGGHGVVRSVGHVPVVLYADVDAVGQSLVGDTLTGVRGLFPGEGHADDARAVLAGGVDRHGTPAAADVQQAPAGPQGELAGDESELVVLGLFEGAPRGGAGQ